MSVSVLSGIQCPIRCQTDLAMSVLVLTGIHCPIRCQIDLAMSVIVLSGIHCPIRCQIDLAMSVIVLSGIHCPIRCQTDLAMSVLVLTGIHCPIRCQIDLAMSVIVLSGIHCPIRCQIDLARSVLVLSGIQCPIRCQIDLAMSVIVLSGIHCPIRCQIDSAMSVLVLSGIHCPIRCQLDLAMFVVLWRKKMPARCLAVVQVCLYCCCQSEKACKICQLEWACFYRLEGNTVKMCCCESILGCVFPLQEVALCQSPPTFSVLCCPCPYRSLLPHTVISPVTFWSSNWSYSLCLLLYTSNSPSIVFHSGDVSSSFPFCIGYVLDYVAVGLCLMVVLWSLSFSLTFSIFLSMARWLVSSFFTNTFMRNHVWHPYVIAVRHTVCRLSFLDWREGACPERFSVLSKNSPSCIYSYRNSLPGSVFHCFCLSQI